MKKSISVKTLGGNTKPVSKTQISRKNIMDAETRLMKANQAAT
jgi:hypothetical protein